MNQRNQILIVDDMEINRAILAELFQKEYAVLEAENGLEALTLVRENRDGIAVILLDIVMPVMDGFQLMEALQEDGVLNRIPVILITADTYRDNEIKGLNLGASDIIMKPFDPHIVKKRVENSVELYRHKNHLEDLVEHQTQKLTETNDFIVDALSTVIEYRNLESGQHIRRIRVFTRTLLECVMYRCPEYKLTHRMIRTIASASAMHDVGKIAIPDSILMKPGRLTAEEFEVMKTHTAKGCEILRTFRRMDDKVYLRYCYDICRYHHERWDGRGYPDGLKGGEIPLCAQVVAIADVYDALTSTRVYKPAYSHEQAVRMILDGECGAFSAQMLRCFREVSGRFREIGDAYRDGREQEEEDPSFFLLSQEELQAEEELARTQVSRGLQEASAGLRKEALERDALINAIPGGVAKVAVNNDFLILLASDGFYKLTGYTRAEYHSSPIEGKGVRLIVEEDIPRVIQTVTEQISRDLPPFVEYRIRKKDGSIAWINVHASRAELENGILVLQAVFIDCTATKRTEQKLLNLMNSVPGGIAQIQLGGQDLLSILYASEGFYQMGGYTREEFQTHFSGKGCLNILHPDDRAKCLDKVAQLLREQDRQFTLELRVLCKDGGVAWHFINGSRTEEENSPLCYQCVFTDITESRRAEELLRVNEKRYRILIEQVQEVIFEWNILEDTMYHSPAFEKRFGYQMPVDHFYEAVLQSDIIYPKDRESLEELHRLLLAGEPSVEREFRVKAKDGGYLWCCVRATVIFGSGHVPVRAVGTISDVDDYKKQNALLEDKAQKDLLTGLYNKVTMENRIEDYLCGEGASLHHALLILDIDNFKQINDTFGHLAGDDILRDVSACIQEHFRGGDIIGRAGGDEFVIFCKDVSSEESVRERAVSLNRVLRRLSPENGGSPVVSGSIGVSLFPKNGESFSSLYRNADKALYASKRSGKDRSTFFQPE